eukprot:scaffold993_cov393-Prasinococcus_capsulatus_cf.AAC.3
MSLGKSCTHARGPNSYLQVHVQVLEHQIDLLVTTLSYYLYVQKSYDVVGFTRKHLQNGDLAKGCTWHTFFIHGKKGFLQGHKLASSLVPGLVYLWAGSLFTQRSCRHMDPIAEVPFRIHLRRASPVSHIAG